MFFFFEATLRDGVEGMDGFEFISEEVASDGSMISWRKDIDDASSYGIFSDGSHDVDAFEAVMLEEGFELFVSFEV